MNQDNLSIKKILTYIFIALILSVGCVVGIYIYNFRYNNISTDPERWGQFGDYLGGTLNTLLSIINLIVLTYITVKIVNIEDQRNINSLIESVKPLGVFEFEIGENILSIKFLNVGVGPLLIKEVEIFKDDKKKFTNFKDLLDDIHPLAIRFNYIGEKNNDSIIRKDHFTSFLDINIFKEEENLNKYYENINALNKLKEELANYKIKIKYTDLYKKIINICEENLNEIAIDCTQK